jgi:uroporphyrin-III C-methyltransferase
MNELPPTPESNPPTGSPASFSAPPPAAPVRPASASIPLQHPVTLALAGLALLLGIEWWSTHSDIRTLRTELARRLQTGEVVNAETKILAKTAQEGMKELQAKVNALENRQTEAQNQQLALEQLYQELSKNRDDWALAEIEQVLSTASQQLQLAGNVQGALIALQNADRSLQRSDKPQFITIRRAIAKDSDKLKALPNMDLTGVALRLDSIIGQIDGLPLLSDEKPALPATQPKNTLRQLAKTDAKTGKLVGGSAMPEWLLVLGDKWQSWTNELWSDVRQLIRVRTVDSPDALLMAPGQAYYARENVKLRLLNARLALLSRNESAFRSDMIAVQDAITKYFDTRARQTQTVQALLKQVQASNLSIEMPTLAESLNAVRNYKVKP